MSKKIKNALSYTSCFALQYLLFFGFFVYATLEDLFYLGLVALIVGPIFFTFINNLNIYKEAACKDK